jgi:RNA polymerase sigma-70 factor (ECF subfamily)
VRDRRRKSRKQRAGIEKVPRSNVIEARRSQGRPHAFLFAARRRNMSWPEWSERVVQDYGVTAGVLAVARHHERALEAIQEALCRLKPACDNQDIADYAHFRNSVRRTAINYLHDGWRREQREANLPDEEFLTGEEEDLDEVARDERIALVREAIEQLPQGERELVLWYFEEGLNYEAIAARLGISTTAAWARMRQPLRTVRMWLLERDEALFGWLDASEGDR